MNATQPTTTRGLSTTRSTSASKLRLVEPTPDGALPVEPPKTTVCFPGFPAPEQISPPEVDLAGRIRAGDRDAETELCQRYHEQLSAAIRRRTRDDATAEDLCQDTFKTAIVKLRQGTLCEPEKLPAFLHGLARNLTTYHYRRQMRRCAWVDEGCEAPEAADPGAQPMSDLLRQERAALVRRVLDELPTARDREILRRFYLSEDDRDVIRREMNISSDHFKRVLYRARQRYRALYEAWVDNHR